MKRNVLCIALAAVIGLLLIACANPVDDSALDAYAARAINLANTVWTDSPLNPETTISFTSDRVILGGEASAASGNKNWYWGGMDGQTLTFDWYEDAGDILEIIDRVEDNWGTNITPPDAVAVVWTVPASKIGFQLHYYAAGSGKSYERLVCWGIGQPHEFIKKP
ncbi:MAG: hypothetical protein LBD48_01135 [Treponema sp.]|jgi:hypothetical protein|nr:hypothetical protein [Treponema sp.]